MKILALEPFYAGSHKEFLDGWKRNSKHEWTILELPGIKWKWRMRHAPLTYSKTLINRIAQNEKWDLIICSSMLSLHELLGFVPELAKIPAIVYFHENQFTYPLRGESKRDYHYAFTNLLTASVANEVWFNSEYHKNDFLSAAKTFLSHMPDYNHLEMISEIETKSIVQHPGIDIIDYHDNESIENLPLHFVWAARWEFDKNPEVLYEALLKVKQSGKRFRLSVLGEQYKDSPEVFGNIKTEFSEELCHFGYLPSREEYLSVLSQSDIYISTAIHEFFGLSCVEAMSQGCFPMVPKRLAYPETVGMLEDNGSNTYFYDGSVDQLTIKLNQLLIEYEKDLLFIKKSKKEISSAMKVFSWENRAKEMDGRLAKYY